ncbi:Tripartite ATP-independent periplasmic transporter DctQ component [Ancylobacter novellus DSM 506]|uniref:TRAP transporter small permease protein n=1 Tax=Ancylobacter novellus (strain ATCC 8093 / DSM 506 / JCM 20403 / CCM 1077 / IAM 12100 / NBRC 12443 / NCIMB 10456) TaxID=639283 RepID=D7A155_ANCN5|nr:TRAP transporter small permease subunit [Ancylobacter novellus]ADH89413.1 Tripartite ATP-independent periplasmic transporter DctQ component [Ancylobacter novellus DSM 506]
MQSVLLGVDRLNAFIGKLFAWCIVILTLAISYEVFRRYVLHDPTTWAYDVSLMLYGALFMMAGAYTLSRNGHVRGDFIYRKWAPATQAKVDLVLYFLFYFPGILALIYSGWNYFYLSYLLNEHSSFSPEGPVIWPFKALIPITGVMMLLQGVVEVVRCVICIRTGDWPQRLHDVEEMEKIILDEAASKDNPEEVLNVIERDSTTRGSL